MWRQEVWVIQQTCLVLSRSSLNLYDAAKRKTMSLLLSTGVSQRGRLVKTGRFPLRLRTDSYKKPSAAVITHVRGLGLLPRRWHQSSVSFARLLAGGNGTKLVWNWRHPTIFVVMWSSWTLTSVKKKKERKADFILYKRQRNKSRTWT